MSKKYYHQSVLLEEVIDFLAPQSNQDFVDLTLGGGGHSRAILEKTGPSGKILAFEMDKRAIKAAQENLKEYKNRLIVVHDSYVHLESNVKKHKFRNISGIVLDLGLSSDQLDQADRGFSFKDHGPLDMRFNPDGQTLTASDIILDWPEEQILKIFKEYGEVQQAKRLAKGIVSWRKNLDKQKQKPIKTSMLVGTILRILNIKESSLARFRKHPATQVFQALRIAVNSELENVDLVLEQAYNVLSPGGRLAVISFHSLEDRIVKNYFRAMSKDCICPPETPVCVCKNKAKLKLLSKKAIKASAQELKKNPRSRSAVLRVIEKI